MRRLTLAVALTLGVAACGDDATTTTAATTTFGGVATTTVATTATTTTTSDVPTTTVAPTTTTTTTTTEPYYSVAWHGIFPDPLLTPSNGHGSGCAPPGDTLPAGIWYGYATAFSAGTLTFDLACFFTGPAGVAAAAADGDAGYDLDFYIRNMNPKLFTIDLDPNGTAYSIDATASDVMPIPGPMTDWPAGTGYVDCPGDVCGVWLFVNGGVVTELVEQYLP